MDEEQIQIAAERRRSEAAQWFARLKTVPVSQATLDDFFTWRRDTGNAEAFEEAERFWSTAGKAGERPALLRAIAAAEQRPVVRRGTMAMRSLAIAAMVCAVIAVGVWVGRSLLPMGQHFDTGVGEQRVVALQDGSRLNLNTQTALRVNYSANERHLTLRSGEALFSVAKNKKRPFVVSAGGVVVTATGTRFDVALDDKMTKVTLIEGRVSIETHDGATTWLAPGEQWRSLQGRAQVRKIATQNVTAWTQGRVVFDNVALAGAIAEINRYGGRSVLLDAPQFGARRLSGSFEAGDSESFVAAVTGFFPLRARVDEQGRIHLRAERQK